MRAEKKPRTGKPSQKAQILAACFPEAFSDAKQAATFLRAVRDTAENRGSAKAADLADRVLGLHGDCRLASSNGRAVAYYANAGDTYATTVLVQSKPTLSVRVTSWGDWVEAQEKRGNRFD